MDWITKEYVAEQAELGEIPALECSLLHHQQGRDADWVELRDAIENGRFTIKVEFCSCCQAVGNFKGSGTLPQKACPKCPLFDSPYRAYDIAHCCDGTWTELWYAHKILRGDYSNANFRAFQEAEGKVCDYIERVLELKKAEKAVEPPRQLCKKCNNCIHWDKAKDSPCFTCELFKNFQPKSPQLRHGDYGYGDEEPILLRMNYGNTEDYPYLAVDKHGLGCGVCSKTKSGSGRKLVILGNIFDDLARNAEDLEEFELCTKDSFRFRSKIMGDSINMKIQCGESCYGLDQATEIAHKILQEVATARRKGAKQ